MTKELQLLKQTLKSHPNDDRINSIQSPSDRTTSPQGIIGQNPQLYQEVEGHDSEAPFGLSEQDASSRSLPSAELGNCFFDKAEVLELFRLFHKSFHPHVPIIDTTLPIQTIKETSPFLFWTIIFLASRYTKDHVHKANLLVEAYSDLVNQTIVKIPLSFYTVQALLCLCTWPLPVMRQQQDPSSMYSVIAVHAASQLSLPLAADASSRALASLPTSVRHGMVKTWLECFIRSTTLALMNGLPPPLRSPNDLRTVTGMIKLDSLPTKLMVEAEILRCLTKHYDSLVGEMDSFVRDTIVQLCVEELDSITSRLQCSFDAYLSFSFWMAKLHIYALALVKETQQLKDKRYFEPDTLCSKLQQLAMTTAYRIIDIYCNELGTQTCETFDMSLVNQHIALPKSYFFGVMVATFLLIKYSVLNKSLSDERKTESRRKIQMVHTKLQEYSSHQYTEPGRAASVIEVLCRGTPETIELGAEIEVDGGASIALNALIAAANLRGRRNLKSHLLQSLNPVSPPSTSNKSPLTTNEADHGAQANALIEMLEETPSIPSDVWNQSFMEMLDFNNPNLYFGVEDDTFVAPD
ncbi:hypothetical protein PV08_02972 [Exophiala spinifera]|uniref:Xylanolytic transcriptional activator regulatory domain-containing protein n=1 Tax=Exophiala spinifera TaxID=91928 RepID=A0A0D2BI93_9EURO|nr:uncharacterized protein PV08_02972 [Exophiala spinifera]KIW18683.1 hypothetical protein PV08_02972 [Exophiala spinifera]